MPRKRVSSQQSTLTLGPPAPHGAVQPAAGRPSLPDRCEVQAEPQRAASERADGIAELNGYPARWLCDLPIRPCLRLRLGRSASARARQHGGSLIDHAWVALDPSDYRARIAAGSAPALDANEWLALVAGAEQDRGSPIVGQWLSVKATSPHMRLSTDITVGSVQPTQGIRAWTTAAVLRAWDLTCDLWLAGDIAGVASE